MFSLSCTEQSDTKYLTVSYDDTREPLPFPVEQFGESSLRGDKSDKGSIAFHFEINMGTWQLLKLVLVGFVKVVQEYCLANIFICVKIIIRGSAGSKQRLVGEPIRHYNLLIT